MDYMMSLKKNNIGKLFKFVLKTKLTFTVMHFVTKLHEVTS